MSDLPVPAASGIVKALVEKGIAFIDDEENIRLTQKGFDLVRELGIEPYVEYVCQEIEGKLFAGLLFNGQINLYEQTTAEQMVQIMARVHRVVVYSYEVVTYIKDIYPEIDQKVFSIAREIGKRLGKAPELEELAKIYGMEIKSLEDKLRLIEKLLENPVRTPFGEVSLPSFNHPLRECE